MAEEKKHPEQDPAEGSRATIDRELARQGETTKSGESDADRRATEEETDRRK